jgi:hypothetical protein
LTILRPALSVQLVPVLKRKERSDIMTKVPTKKSIIPAKKKAPPPPPPKKGVTKALLPTAAWLHNWICWW